MAIIFDGFTHRRGGFEDAEEIAEFTRSAYEPWVAILGREPLPMTADYQAALENHRFDLVCKGGSIRALLETERRGDSLWIENIAVDPALHGKGMGRSLLDLSRQIAIADARKTITLVTNAKMTRNIDIYRKYGFNTNREEAVSHGKIIYMSMPL